MDIMTTLFDQDHITELYGYEQRKEGKIEGRIEGKIEGIKDATLNAIRNLMQSLSISNDKAMALLMIPEQDQAIYKEALSKENQKE